MNFGVNLIDTFYIPEPFRHNKPVNLKPKLSPMNAPNHSKEVAR